MKYGVKRIAATMLALVVGAGLFSGCSNKGEQTAGTAAKLTYWVPLSGNAANTVTTYDETPFAKELEKRVGINIEYQHPPQGQEQEKFNILTAMKDLPDIVFYNWFDYPGGPDKAIEEGKIIDLTDKIQEKAPNFYQYLQEHPEEKKMMESKNGKIFCFPFIRGDKSLQFSRGLVIRKDWLDDLSLEVPATIDEWETVLTAFKDKKNATPLAIANYDFISGTFCGAYGVAQTYYAEDGTVKYGPLEPGFKDFVIKMNDWYKKGLIDSNIATYDTSAVEAKLLTDKLGATVGSVGSGIGKWTAAAKTEGFALAAVPMPTLNKGDAVKFGFMQLPVVNQGAAITVSCKDIDAAFKLLDYGYSAEGAMMFNFGIEGESYEMVDGYPTYTDNITKNPDGLSMAAALGRYAQSCDVGCFVQDKRYMEQYAALPQQKEAIEIWSKCENDKYMLPYLYYNDDVDTSDIVKKSTAVDSCVNERVVKFIMGVDPIDKYDEFIAELKSRGAEDVVAAKQAAYDAYASR